MKDDDFTIKLFDTIKDKVNLDTLLEKTVKEISNDLKFKNSRKETRQIVLAKFEKLLWDNCLDEKSCE